MIRLSEPDHACRAVYADDTALRYSQGKLVAYSAVATTHIEHNFVAIETVARQYCHRDCKLNIGVGAVLVWVPVCRRIAHARLRINCSGHGSPTRRPCNPVPNVADLPPPRG